MLSPTYHLRYVGALQKEKKSFLKSLFVYPHFKVSYWEGRRRETFKGIRVNTFNNITIKIKLNYRALEKNYVPVLNN